MAILVLADYLFLDSLLELTPEDLPEAEPPPVESLTLTVIGLETSAPVPPVGIEGGSFLIFLVLVSFDFVMNSWNS